jgi:hypothetical protein
MSFWGEAEACPEQVEGNLVPELKDDLHCRNEILHCVQDDVILHLVAKE